MVPSHRRSAQVVPSLRGSVVPLGTAGLSSTKEAPHSETELRESLGLLISSKTQDPRAKDPGHKAKAQDPGAKDRGAKARKAGAKAQDPRAKAQEPRAEAEDRDLKPKTAEVNTKTA